MRGTGDATRPQTGKLTVLLAAALAFMTAAQAQDWPQKTVRVIHPSAPGTITDIVQTASKFCFHQWGLKPTLLDQCNSSNLKALILVH
jgi:hypothetical protein